MKPVTDVPDTHLSEADAVANKSSFCFIMPFHISEGRGGGSEVQAWYLARELANRGHRVSYVAQSVRGKRGLIEKLEGVTIDWVRPTRRFRWLNAGAYYKALSRADADIVVQRMTAFTTGVAALWCRRNGRNFVWICTDNDAPINWHFSYRQRELNKSPDVNWIKGAILLVNALATDLVRNWGMKRVAVDFTQNDFQEALLKQCFARDSRRMISGHPVPKKIGDPSTKLEDPIILWVANLAPLKRPEKFIELAHLALGYKLRFVLIGGRDDPSYTSDLMKDLPHNLKWLGRLPFEETLRWFDQASFFVNTSTKEGFPNTFIQAWLRGVPVLSIGVDPDAVIEANGLGFVNSDLSVLLARIDQLSTDVSRYKRLSRHVRNYATENFSTGRMTDNFLAELGVE